MSNESGVSTTEILTDVAAEEQTAKLEKVKKQYFYKKPSLQTPHDASAKDTTISYPCISERYRQSLEGQKT